MKTRIVLLSFLWTVFYGAATFAHQSPEGAWVTIDDQTGEKGAVIQFMLQQDELTGTVVNIYPHPGDTGICKNCPGHFKDKPVRGLQIVWGLKHNGHGEWEGGQILDARSGKIYNVKMAVKGGKLHVRGYIGLSWLGRTQVWEPA